MNPLLPALMLEKPIGVRSRARGFFNRHSYEFLLPVEIAVPRLDENRNVLENEDGSPILEDAKELKVARWDPLDTWDLGPIGYSVLPNLDKDRDRFYVRIPGLNNSQKVSVVIETIENPDPAYNDDPSEIELKWDNDFGGWVSPSMNLVSDEQDDKFDGEKVGQDDQLNDRTHRVQLGGKVRIKEVIIDGTSSSLDIKLPVLVKKTLTLTAIVLRETVGGIPSVANSDVMDDIRAAKERYAQIGVEIKLNGAIKVVDPPPGVDLSDGLDDNPEGSPMPAQEKQLLIDAYGTHGTDDLHVFYVTEDVPEGAAGSSEWLGGFSASDKLYTSPDANPYLNNVFLFQEHAVTGMVLPHEIAHILLKSGYHALANETSILAGGDPNAYDNKNVDKGKRIGKESDPESAFGTETPDLGEIMLQNSLLKSP